MNDEKINIDPVVKSLFEEAGTERPSPQFSDKIMHKIHEKSLLTGQAGMKSVFVYKPVISRKAWILIAFCAMAIFVYLLTGSAGDVQSKDIYGFSLPIDTAIFSAMMQKFAGFVASPVLKATISTFAVLAFANQLILYWKGKSMTN